MGIALLLLQSALGIYGAVYLFTSISTPSWFLTNMSVDELDRRSIPKWRMWFKFGCTILGLGVLMYAASYAIVAAIPHSWGSYNEDGEWEYARSSLKMIVAFFGAFAIASKSEDNARAIIKSKVDELARRSLMASISNSVHSHKAFIDAARSALERDLKLDEFPPSNWASKYRREFLQNISLQLEQAAVARSKSNGESNSLL